MENSQEKFDLIKQLEDSKIHYVFEDERKAGYIDAIDLAIALINTTPVKYKNKLQHNTHKNKTTLKRL